MKFIVNKGLIMSFEIGFIFMVELEDIESKKRFKIRIVSSSDSFVEAERLACDIAKQEHGMKNPHGLAPMLYLGEAWIEDLD